VRLDYNFYVDFPHATWHDLVVERGNITLPETDIALENRPPQ